MARQKRKKGLLERFSSWFRHLSKKKKIALITGLVVLVLVLVAGGYALSKLNKIERTIVDPGELSIVDVDGFANILLLGVDTRDMNDIKGSRSDAIMIVSINTNTNEVNLISLYRDTFLKLGDAGGYDKITHACSYGGPELTVQSLNQALDLNISNYVVVNFKAVADLVDAVGGITVNVKDYEIEQLNKYTKQTAHNVGEKHYNLVKEPGKQTLQGVQAVSYGRIRKGVGDDYKRTERMRIVLTKVFGKMKEMSIFQLDDIADMMLPQVQTTLTNRDILSLMFRLNRYQIVGSTGFPYSVMGGMINGISYVIPTDLAGDVKRLHTEMFGQEGYAVSSTCSTIAAGINAAASAPDVEKKPIKEVEKATEAEELNEEKAKKEQKQKEAAEKQTEPTQPQDEEMGTDSEEI